MPQIDVLYHLLMFIDLIEILDLSGNKILVIFLDIMDYWNRWLYVNNFHKLMIYIKW
jgi:hypothetical protein